MALSKIVLTYTWENANLFKLVCKEGDGAAKTIIEMQENSNIPLLWPGATKIVDVFTKAIMVQIGNEMAAP